MKYIRDLFQGRKPLWLTFWVFGVGGVVVCRLLFLLAVYLEFSQNIGGHVLFWSALVLNYLYSFFICAGTFHSAGRYTGPPLWKFFAMAVSVFVLFCLVASLFSLPQTLSPPA